MEGTISVMAHYYEKGNVQMHNVKDVAAVDIGDVSALFILYFSFVHKSKYSAALLLRDSLAML